MESPDSPAFQSDSDVAQTVDGCDPPGDSFSGASTDCGSTDNASTDGTGTKDLCYDVTP